MRNQLSFAGSILTGILMPASLVAAAAIGDGIDAADSRPYGEGYLSRHNGFDGTRIDYRQANFLGFRQIAMSMYLDGEHKISIASSDPEIRALAHRFLAANCNIVKPNDREGNSFTVENSQCAEAGFNNLSRR